LKRRSFDWGQESLSPSDQFRSRLLELTLRAARRRSSLYRAKWIGTPIAKGFELANLDSLPLVTKAEIHQFEKEWAANPRVVAVQNTSGSTGTPLFLYRTVDEFGFIEKFFTKADGVRTEKAPLGLHLAIPQHGAPTPIPGHVFSLQSSATNDKLLAYSNSLIQKQFLLPHVESRVSVLSGDHNSNLLLARLYDEQREKSVPSAIKVVCLTGRQLTIRWRKELERIWGCQVVDRFSMSEVFGGATICNRCGGYHFDPYVIPEIIEDPSKSHRAIKVGYGHLALTSLAPFVSNQPFIRYLTGDIFGALETECSEISYFPQGRSSQALLKSHINKSGSNKLVLAPRELIDVLDQIVGIARPSAFADVSIVRNKSDINIPYVRGSLELSGGIMQVVIELAVAELPRLSIRASDVEVNSPLWPLADLISARIGIMENCVPVIRNLEKSQLTSVEKKTTFWIDSPQK
jgi:phenylacetate-coenzyme A ligase PaaK-like adenylate-forming protein